MMTIDVVSVLFDFFALIAIGAALIVITQNNPVRAVLALVLVFFATSGIWILAHAEFLALILVLVYVGAVMTLFLFVVMMINVDFDSMKKRLIYYLPFLVFIVVALVSLVMMVSPKELLFKSNDLATHLTNTQALGMKLYIDYAFACEVAAVLLLVAIIAAISLAHRATYRDKRQSVLKQIMTKKEDRLKIVKMTAQTKLWDKE